jgi:predicted dehydrogenase
MSLAIGVIGCGSVFAGPYAGTIELLRSHSRVHVSAVYDVDQRKRHRAAAR